MPQFVISSSCNLRQDPCNRVDCRQLLNVNRISVSLLQSVRLLYIAGTILAQEGSLPWGAPQGTVDTVDCSLFDVTTCVQSMTNDFYQSEIDPFRPSDCSRRVMIML